jgi:hypothetical protein
MHVRTDVPYCASCYQARPGQPHVDFDAAYDGPVLDAAAAMQIDDLVICHVCLGGAARLLGYVLDEDRPRLQQVEAEKVALRERAQAAESGAGEGAHGAGRRSATAWAGTPAEGAASCGLAVRCR